jgi:hypothetical protein
VRADREVPERYVVAPAVLDEGEEGGRTGGLGDDGPLALIAHGHQELVPVAMVLERLLLRQQLPVAAGYIQRRRMRYVRCVWYQSTMPKL